MIFCAVPQCGGEEPTKTQLLINLTNTTWCLRAIWQKNKKTNTTCLPYLANYEAIILGKNMMDQNWRLALATSKGVNC